MIKGKQILEGSRAISLTIKNINPAVVSAYPITPQTHIVEDLAKAKADGQAAFSYIRAESEFAAASIVLGASATGMRTYSATSSQGLLLMAEVLFNISGLRLPIVMTCANRALSAPINIWNDHSDAMALRDSGWIQLFASDNQEAVYFHILAYKIAEKLKLPVLVNVDGFILTHAYSPVLIPTAANIKKFLPAYSPALGEYLDPRRPVTLGGFFTPEDYLEVRQSLHEDLVAATSHISQEYKKMSQVLAFSPQGDGLIEYVGHRKAKIVLVAMGSLTGTIEEAIGGQANVGLLKIKTYRPFPESQIKDALKFAKHIAVIEKAISPGQFGPLYSDLSTALGRHKLNIKNYIVGLGGRDVTSKMIKRILSDAKQSNARLKFIGKI